MVNDHGSTGPRVVAVSRDDRHNFSKKPVEVITLVAGIGVEGDAHAGTTVQHQSRVAKNPHQANLRQVHLMHSELFDELRQRGFDVQAADLGENITTVGVDLLLLPRGTRLRIGDVAEVEVTGLRNPCSQINDFMPALMREVVHLGDDGSVIRRTGVMGVVTLGGDVRAGDPIVVEPPTGEHVPLDLV